MDNPIRLSQNAALVARRRFAALIMAAAAVAITTPPGAAQGNTAVIGALTPSSTIAGSSGFSLLVEGTNFRDNSIVRWNGANRSTTYISDTQLRASISASDLAQAGVAQVTVMTPVGQQQRVSAARNFPVKLVPNVVSLAPAPALAGGLPFLLDVIGTRFAPGAIVRWGSSERATTLVGSNTLRISVSADDIRSVGSVPVTVLNPGAAGDVSAVHTYSITHQRPVIQSLSPASAISGGGEFILTVNGTNFIRDTSVVRWNGERRATTFVSRTQLRAIIGRGDIANAGTATVTVLTRLGSPSQISGGASLTVQPKVVSYTLVEAVPVRLGTERLTERGQWAGVPLSQQRTLNCHGFGTSYVMVGVRGKSGWAIDELRVGCRQLQADGTLGSRISWTDRWDQKDDGGTAFPDRVCQSGYAVSSVEVRIDFGQLRRLTLKCRKLGSSGVTSGSEATLQNVGYNVGGEAGPDSCSSGRPARALRLSAAQYNNNTFPTVLMPWIVAGLQLICEQPERPR